MIDNTKMDMFNLIEIDEDNLELLRCIRNECRLFMTRNDSEISKAQQAKWFRTINKNQFMPYIFNKGSVSIGYGAIKIDGDEALLTGGLLLQYRGHGYGLTLFEYLIEKSKRMDKRVELEVLKNNIRAIKTYRKLGFRITYETERIYKMILSEV